MSFKRRFGSKKGAEGAFFCALRPRILTHGQRHTYRRRS